MEQVGIETVLNKLNDTVDLRNSTVKEYGLRFLKDGGEKREIRCRKYTKGLKQSITGQDPRGKSSFNLQAKGLLLLEDLEAAHPKYVHPSMIYGFRDFQSDKWLNVFH